MAGAGHERPCRLRFGLLQRGAEQAQVIRSAMVQATLAGAAFGDGCAQWPVLIMGAVLEVVRLTLEGDEVGTRLGQCSGMGSALRERWGTAGDKG